MKKHLFSSLVKTIFLVWVGFVVLTLSSCENFMQGADVRSQLDKAVSFANAKNCSLFISQETEMGTFLSSGEKECKIGYSVEIVFYLNKDYYVFKNLKAVSVTDESQSRDDCVEFTINEQESDIEKGLYRVTAKLIKEANDIMIKPDCITLPKVTSYFPSSSEPVYSNIPIVITFNKPIDPQTIKGNISIRFNDVDRLQELFFDPYFTNDNTVLTIQPNALELKNLMNNLNAEVLDFKVVLSNKIFITEDNKDYSLVQDSNSTFTVTYDKRTEETAPEKKALFVTRHQITLDTASEIAENNNEQFNQDDIADPPSYINSNLFIFGDYEEKILQNRTGGTVYIYGQYTDKDSGVKSVFVSEQRTNGWNSLKVQEDSRETIITDATPNVEFKTIDKTTFFCIPYKITSDDGAVHLSIKVCDAAGNYDAVEEFTAIKKSKAVITNAHSFGTPGNFSYDDDYVYEEEYSFLFDKLENGDITIEEYNTSIKSIQDCITLEDSIEENEICTLYWLENYGIGIYMPPKEVKCEYMNNGEPVSKVFFKNDYWSDYYERYYYWYGYSTLDGVDSIAGLDVTIIVSDDIGNTATKQIRLPSADDVSLIIEKQSADTAKVSFRNDRLESMDDIIQVKLDGKDIKGFSSDFTEGNRIIGQKDIEAGYDYKMSLCINGFLTEFNNKTYSITSGNNSTNAEGEVIILKDENGNKQYSLDTTTVKMCSYIGPYINVTIPVSTDSVTKYDSIYAQSTFKYWNNSNTLCTYSEKGSNQIVVQIPTKAFLEDNVNITLYGVINQTTTRGIDECCKLQIDKFQKTNEYYKYDNIEPVLEYYWGESLEESAYFWTRTDGIAYPLYIEARIDDYPAKIFYPLSPGWSSKKLEIPYHDFISYGKDVYHFYCTVYLNNGLDYLLDIPVEFMDYPSGSFTSIEKKTGFWNLITDKSPAVGFEDVRINDIFVYKLQTTQNQQTSQNVTSWVDATPDDKTEWDYDTSGSNGVITTVQAYGLPENQYVRIITALNENHSRPAYLYTGTPGTGTKDLFLSGGFADTYAIASDAPVFVHTLVTSRPYEECKDWSAKEWEYYKKHVGEQVLNFTSNNTGVQAYTAPVSSTQIKSGDCYVVIAHYSTGRIAMSPVMVKN